MNVGKPSPAALAAKKRQQQRQQQLLSRRSSAPHEVVEDPSLHYHKSNSTTSLQSNRASHHHSQQRPATLAPAVIAPSSAISRKPTIPAKFGSQVLEGAIGAAYGKYPSARKGAHYKRHPIPANELERSEGYRRHTSRSSGRSRSVTSSRNRTGGENCVDASSDSSCEITEVVRDIKSMHLSKNKNAARNGTSSAAQMRRLQQKGSSDDDVSEDETDDDDDSRHSWGENGHKFQDLLGGVSTDSLMEDSSPIRVGSSGRTTESWEESEEDEIRNGSSSCESHTEDDDEEDDESIYEGGDNMELMSSASGSVLEEEEESDLEAEDEDSQNGAGSPDDYTDDEDEGEEGYKPGGYHPVKFGEVYGRRYVVIKKLGWGHFSTVWMVRDTQCADGDPRQFLALKVQKSAEHYTEAAMDEIELLDCAQEERRRAEEAYRKDNKGNDEKSVSNMDNMAHSRHTATLVHSFFHFGPNGRHMCMVFEMLGCNLLSVIKAHNYRGIPIDAVKSMIRGICRGLDFLHRKCSIIHTDLKPENVLLQFHQMEENNQLEESDTVSSDHHLSNKQMAAQNFKNNVPPQNPMNNLKVQNNSQQQQQQQQTIEDIEALLNDPKTTQEERKRLRKKLKRKRQREKKRQQRKENLMEFNEHSTNNDLNGGEAYSDQSPGPAAVQSPAALVNSPRSPISMSSFQFLSDAMIFYILSQKNSSLIDNGRSLSHLTTGHSAGSGLTARSGGTAGSTITAQRVDQSTLVERNFALNATKGDCLDDILDGSVVRSLNRSDLLTEFDRRSDGGLAEVSFLLRTFVPEGELADHLSRVIGVDWVKNQSSREWCCSFSLKNLEQEATFQLIQKGRKELDSNLRKVLFSSVDIVSREIVRCSFPQKSASSRMNGGYAQSQLLPYSLFTLKFPIKSTIAVLGFLESKVPGLIFLSHKKNSGLQQLDQLAFGEYSDGICKHQIKHACESHHSKNANGNNYAKEVPHSIIGFDLRMVKEFGARPKLGEDGVACFELGGPMDTVNVWWSMRKPLENRIGPALGEKHISLQNMAGSPEVSETKSEGTFSTCVSSIAQEQNPAVTTQTPVSSPQGSSHCAATNSPQNLREVSKSPTLAAANRIAQLTSPVNLKNIETLKQARTVVVDLGNACWTHRHFSEDIQTRQYRSPEVIIGSKYDTSADMWSLGCICFELLTGDLLFDPRAGEDYDRDEDHLAMFQELLGKFPKKLAQSGKYSKNFFNRRGDLKHIQQLKFWPIDEVLHDKYHFPRDEAKGIAEFILLLLEFNPKKRATAADCLRSKWLNGDTNNDTSISNNGKAILRRRRPGGR
mmetsp:Transcript_35798/g.83379  ORF Transcript_35798/g.83379 Transcript_35798/m.83379 type:complete len:1315 (-) Transcript_35798:54-3998(-)|eukprot:CAMPEP_0113299490 /NCGR_PEP_ID=MMETSP0010_2-20120614/1504_1 /TAXON_ID=216773 ORGANISM="Corethron hystrix, Strain 308" /NCGR_SAMPLE_ID=MMETSP0010_2 /ASSEMBLY_ACC=CAM_ASM_000155 /LENGTH=1314 /DNA_ID=CAMNT_0000152735 /DNA_START=503 /DNA_END=4447 /DNA_ORIENTATION=+ /assembly_acc=CAM_ASM_000155